MYVPRYNTSSNFKYKAHQIPKHKCFTSRLAIVFAECIEVRSRMKNEVALTGDAPTTSVWSTIAYSGAAYNSGLIMHMCDACDGI